MLAKGRGEGKAWTGRTVLPGSLGEAGWKPAGNRCGALHPSPDYEAISVWTSLLSSPVQGLFIQYPSLLPKAAEEEKAPSLIHLNKPCSREAAPQPKLEASSILIVRSCPGFSPVSGGMQGTQGQSLWRAAPRVKQLLSNTVTIVTTITST